MSALLPIGFLLLLALGGRRPGAAPPAPHSRRPPGSTPPKASKGFEKLPSAPLKPRRGITPSEAAFALRMFIAGGGGCGTPSAPLRQIRVAQHVLGVPATGYVDAATKRAAGRHGVQLPCKPGETKATKSAANAERAAKLQALQKAKAAAARKAATLSKRRAAAAASKAKAAQEAAKRSASEAAKANAEERKKQAQARAAEHMKNLRAARAAEKKAKAAAAAQQAAEAAARKAAGAKVAEAQAQARKASAAAAKARAERAEAIKQAKEAAAAREAAEARAAEQAAAEAAAKTAQEKAAAEAKKRAAAEEARRRAREEAAARARAIAKASVPTPEQAALTLRRYLQTKGSNWGTKAKPSPEIRNAQKWMGMATDEQDGILGPKTRAAARAVGVTFPPASMRGGVRQPTKAAPLPSGVTVEHVKALLLDPRPPAGCGLTIGRWQQATPTQRAQIVASCAKRRARGELPKPHDTSQDRYQYFAN